jgi:hypothetical protein
MQAPSHDLRERRLHPEDEGDSPGLRASEQDLREFLALVADELHEALQELQ